MRSAFRPLPVSILLALAVLAVLVSARDTARAAGFHVNVTYDAVDANPGDFVCETAPGNGECTLRAAVMEANALPGADLVTLGEGEHVLGLPDQFLAGDEDASISGDVDIADDLRLVGRGSESSVVTGVSSLVHVLEEAAVEITDLTLRGVNIGGPGATCGTAIQNLGELLVTRVSVTNNAGRQSGAICNHGTMTMENSAVTDNRTYLAGWGAGIHNAGTAVLTGVQISGNAATFAGGGVYNLGELFVVDSVISGNGATGAASSHFGGGIYNEGTMTVANTTLSENYGQGGGIANFGTGTLTNVTIAGNSTEEGDTDGGIRNQGTVTLTNTIVANNAGGDCSGAVTSAGHNVDSDGTCGLAEDGDLSGVDPLLGGLADNGGPTMTHALLEGSPAIDAGNDDACPETDQRGAPRPANGDGDAIAVCDIGAYEAAGVVPTPGPTPTPTVFPSKPGDIDCDGDVDSTDALALLRFLAGIPWGIAGCPAPDGGAQTADSAIPPSASPTPPAEHKRGDINCDGVVNAVDTLTLLRYVAGFAVGLPPGCGELG